MLVNESGKNVVKVADRKHYMYDFFLRLDLSSINGVTNGPFLASKPLTVIHEGDSDEEEETKELGSPEKSKE